MKTSSLFLNSISIAVSAFALAACAPADPQLQQRAADPVQVSDKANVFNEYEPPQVDILFVMDDSRSMAEHQEKLIRNIDKFAESFIRNQDVDFHVGVVKVYDSIRYGAVAGHAPNGQLVGGVVSRGGDTVAELRRILNVGVLPVEEGGPEFEEVFSPIRAALSPEMLGSTNQGFYRENAHLAIIMVTDANDASPNFDESRLESFLYNLKRGRTHRFSTYGVIAGPDNNTCRMDPSGAPTRITNFLRRTGGRTLSLCDRDYGRKLGEVGSEISARAVFSRVVTLSYIPDLAFPVTVTCENQVIPQGANGWSYENSSGQHKIVVAAGYAGCRGQSSEIVVDYTRVESQDIVPE